MSLPLNARCLIESGQWAAEEFSTWSHAVTSQVIDDCLYNVRVAFIKHKGFCTTLLSIFGPLGLDLPVSESPQRFSLTNTWDVDGRAEVAFGYVVAQDAPFDEQPGAISISVMPSRDAHVLLEAMQHGEKLNLRIGDVTWAFSLDGAGSAIDAALAEAEGGLAEGADDHVREG